MAGSRAVVAAAWTRRVGDNGAGRGPDQPAGDGAAGRAGSQASDQGAAAAADQCAAKHAILPRSLASGERQGHDGHENSLCIGLPLR